MATRSFNRRPVAWPFRLLSWLVTVALVLLIASVTAVGAVVIGATARYELTRTKSGDLDKIIETKLSKGVPADRITTVLDSEGIEHGVVEPFPGDDTDLLYAGVTKGTPLVHAFVRNEGFTLELVDVKVTFILDENGKLKDHMVTEVHHRPDWLQELLP